MQKCKVCGNTEFFTEAGFYFCQTCQTQNEDVREEVLEIRVDPKTRLRRTRIRDPKADKTESDVIGWTSWELYNFILIGLTNELMELGITSDIKLTVLQLWATYLGKLEVAFTSTTRRHIPKLARRFNQRDAEIIYGKVKIQRKRRRRKKNGSSAAGSVISGFQSDCSSMRELNKTKKLMATADYKRFMDSQGSSEGDTLSLHNQSLYSVQSSALSSVSSTGSTKSRVKFSTHAKKEAEKVSKLSKKLPRHERAKYKKKHITVQYKSGPHLITPMRLWAILYLALRIHKQPIHLGDMLRYGREGHLSYYKLEHLLPPEVNLTKHDVNLLSQNMEITHKGMRRMVATMAKYLGVWELVCPDFFPLISRYCEELELPRGVLLYVERLIALSPPKMVFNKSKTCLPNYEGRAIAFIIVVLKLLFGLDGITECEISTIAGKINSMVFNKNENCECYSIDISAPCIIVHGGAVDRNDSIVVEKLMSCKKAASNGYEQLIHGKSSIDAVEAALWWLECDEFFNCGYGSVLNDIGDVQMDACIIDGSKSECGSVAAVTDIEHPISFAKYILEHFPNTIVVGTDAKVLAKQANINWLSKNSMVSPTARLAYESANMTKLQVDVDPVTVECVKVLKNSHGTAGCVAWDGQRIAAGTTTGGRNKKIVGSLGSSSIFGCDTFAGASVGCSLTGHAESMLKFITARKISEDIENNCIPHEALKNNFDEMLNKSGHTGGGIVLERNGSWGAYFTSETMPYAIIKDDWITFGTDLNERKTELYRAYHTEFPNERGILDAKLFNFREWQRYIECRKSFLINLHLPTKLKYAPHVPRVNSLYINFLKYMHSKNEREEPEMTNYKHHLPRELANAMKHCIDNLNQDNVPLKEADYFAPSLTPLHSYIQQVTDHPFHELPSFLRCSFFATKIGYITKPEALVQLAAQCNVDLTVIDSNLHFIEKMVPHYEPLKMPSVKELKEIVKIQKVAGDAACANSENIHDYLDKKIPCVINVDEEKQMHYDAVQKTVKHCEDFENDFGYENVFPDGRLLIPDDSDSESDDNDVDNEDLKDSNIKLLNPKFCRNYNLDLLQCEKESIRCEDIANRIFKQSSKPILIRNSKGQFIKSTDIPTDSNSVESPKVSKKKQTKKKEQPKDEEKDIFQTERDDLDAGSSRDEDFLNLSNISSLEDDSVNHIDTKFHDISDTVRESATLFRPFKDYWMYHCVFSRVKPKNFELFEKSLPVNFRWLLNECAQTVEMSSYDLYEEVCLIESYLTHILKPDSIRTANRYTKIDPKSKAFRNSILNKW